MDDTAGEDDIVIAISTVPDDATGSRIARVLVEEGVVGCVSRVAGIVSTYRFEGALHEDPEVLLVMKTVRGQVPGLERRLAALHPYEVPELVVVETAAAAGPYAHWLRSVTGGGG